MYNYAIVRKPGTNFSDGITASNLGMPNYEKALRQHRLYCGALRKCGLKVIALEPDLRYPDGCFVEDTAIITEKGAIITRPGQPKRLGEEERIKEVISGYMNIESIKPPGTVDGGDILRVNDHFYIGLSKRTNREGARQLASILSRQGYNPSAIPVKQVLHLKTGVTYIGSNTLVAIKEFSNKFQSFDVIEADEAERYAANCLLVNGFLLIPKGFPKTKQKILGLERNIIEIEMSEFRKMDGGLTCLSLLF